jgi:hypothetical protein
MMWMHSVILHLNHVLMALWDCRLKPFLNMFWFVLVSVYMFMVCVCTPFNKTNNIEGMLSQLVLRAFAGTAVPWALP